MAARKPKKTGGPGGNGGATAGRSQLSGEQHDDMVELVANMRTLYVQKRTIKAAVREQYRRIMGLDESAAKFSASSIDRLIREADANLAAAAPVLIGIPREEKLAQCIRGWEAIVADPNARPQEKTNAIEKIAIFSGLQPAAQVEMQHSGAQPLPQAITVEIINVAPAVAAPITKPPKSIVIQTRAGNGSNGASGNGSAG